MPPILRKVEVELSPKKIDPKTKLLNEGKKYLAKIDGKWETGTFSLQWYGWLFHYGWTTAQFDKYTKWQEIYEIAEDPLPKEPRLTSAYKNAKATMLNDMKLLEKSELSALADHELKNLWSDVCGKTCDQMGGYHSDGCHQLTTEYWRRKKEADALEA